MSKSLKAFLAVLKLKIEQVSMDFSCVLQVVDLVVGHLGRWMLVYCLVEALVSHIFRLLKLRIVKVFALFLMLHIWLNKLNRLNRIYYWLWLLRIRRKRDEVLGDVCITRLFIIFSNDAVVLFAFLFGCFAPGKLLLQQGQIPIHHNGVLHVLLDFELLVSLLLGKARLWLLLIAVVFIFNNELWFNGGHCEIFGQ